MNVLAAVLLVGGVAGVVVPSAHAAEYDCGDALVCDAGDACALAAEQSSDFVGAAYQSTGGVAQAWAFPHTTTNERSLFTTCLEVSLRVYTTAAYATASVTGCDFDRCNVWSWFRADVEDVQGNAPGAWCLGASNCAKNSGVAQSNAKKEGIDISIPHTDVYSYNCDYAVVKAYFDELELFLAEADPGCSRTTNHIGLL